MALFDAAVDLNPHQIEAALLALPSPLSKGVILADEVGLGKTIEAGIVRCQLWAERKRRLLIVCPASIRKQWALELEEKFHLPVQVLAARAYRDARRYETSILLIGLDRLSAALINLGTAIESALKVWMVEQGSSVDELRWMGLTKLVKRFGAGHKSVSRFQRHLAEDFEDEDRLTLVGTRNRFVHRGPSPKDDAEARLLLAVVGFPYYEILLREKPGQIRGHPLARSNSDPVAAGRSGWNEESGPESTT